MKKVEFTLSIGFACAEHREVVEYDDDIADAEIAADYECWCANYIDGGWRVLEDEEDDG